MDVVGYTSDLYAVVDSVSGDLSWRAKARLHHSCLLCVFNIVHASRFELIVITILSSDIDDGDFEYQTLAI